MQQHTLVWFALLAWSCGSATPVTRVAETTTAGSITSETPVEIEAGDLIAAEGTTAFSLACTSSESERCDALDDDCDGRVDETHCPVDSGADLTVAVAWNIGGDLDLYVTKPSGERLSFQSPSSGNGSVDLAGRGDCGAQEARALRYEHFAQRAPVAPGRYRVELHYLMECGPNTGAATAVITVALQGRVLGTWNRTLTPGETVAPLEFTLIPRR